MTTTDWIGSLGVFMILLAYFCNTFKLLSSRSPHFYSLNAVGATLACLTSYLLAYWPFVVLQGIWVVISVIGLARSLQSNRK
jgi:hypothetical protein